jgi:hypothetical protein
MERERAPRVAQNNIDILFPQVCRENQAERRKQVRKARRINVPVILGRELARGLLFAYFYDNECARAHSRLSVSLRKMPSFFLSRGAIPVRSRARLVIGN